MALVDDPLKRGNKSPAGAVAAHIPAQRTPPAEVLPPLLPVATRLPSLTGLRFVAAFLVFGFHVQVAGLVDVGPAAEVVRFLFGQGSAGVTFFFILSGFVLAWSARPGDTAGRFWRRRAAKIYPNHLVTFCAALALAVAGAGALSASVIVPNVLLIQAWFPNPDIYYGLNTVSWSLACEVLFYALFPLLYLFIRRIPGRSLWPAAVAALALIWLVPLVVNLVPGANHYWAIWLFPVARTPEFIAGMVLARVVQDGRWPRRILTVWPITAFTVVVYLVSRWAPEDIAHVALPSLPFALLIGAVAAADAFGSGTLWRRNWAVWLGEVSFAFYMVHQLVLRVVAKAVGTSHSLVVEVAMAVAALGLAILASWALYRLVEVPGLRLLGPRRRAGRATPTRVAAS